MSQNIVYVGIDVDDASYHGCALNPHTGEVLDFHCRPTLKGLVGQLEKLRAYFGAVQLKLCREASYVGFSLQRDLKARGYDCAVVAPSSIPRQLVSWVGMDIRKYASGDESHRFGFTRQGNHYLRTAFIEANQRGYRSARLGKDVKARRANSAPEYVATADRCLRRLNKKGNRLLMAGKHPNKVKVACAREVVGFVWESLNRVAA